MSMLTRTRNKHVMSHERSILREKKGIRVIRVDFLRSKAFRSLQEIQTPLSLMERARKMFKMMHIVHRLHKSLLSSKPLLTRTYNPSKGVK